MIRATFRHSITLRSANALFPFDKAMAATVRFAYEWHDDSGNWFRSYGNENWEFDEHGLMRLRIASINCLRAGASADAGQLTCPLIL